MEKFVKAFEEMDNIFSFRKFDTSKYPAREAVYLALMGGYRLGGGLRDENNPTPEDREFDSVGTAYLKGGLHEMHRVSQAKKAG